MKELAAVLDELVTCGETLISTANSLRDIFSGDAEAPDNTTPPSKNTKKPESVKAASAPKNEPAPAPKTYTKEQVRGILAAKSAKGHGDEIRALLGKFGAKQLKQVDPSDYSALVTAAESIGTDNNTSGSATGEEASDE